MYKRNVWGVGLERLYTVNESSCWVWSLSKHKSGYGQYHIDKKMWRAHRYFYTVLKGSIPGEMVVHHKCFVRSCVNPDHLELTSHSLNASKEFRKAGSLKSNSTIKSEPFTGSGG